jgi:outer membrane immunogenic protein
MASVLPLTTAFAADPVATLNGPVAAPLVAPFDWSGPYAGAQLGYGWGDPNWVYTGGAAVDINLGGVFGGLHAGYNFQNNNFVYGVEVEGNLSGVDGNAACPNPTFTCTVDVKAFGSARGRLGVTMNDWLFFGHVGFALASIKASTNNGGGISGSSTDTYTGWVAGGGVEKNIPGTNWSFKVEVSRYDFGSGNHTVDNALSVDLDPNVNTVIVGVTKHF